MKLVSRSFAICGVCLAFVASVALLLAKNEVENPDHALVASVAQADRVSHLQYERDALLGDLAQWQQAALDADAAAGALRQEKFRLSQEHKSATAEAAVATAAAERLTAQLASARGEVDRLRRTLFKLQASAAVRPQVAPPGSPAEQPSPVKLPVQALAEPEDETLSILRVSADGRMAALGYGRKHGASNGQVLLLHVGQGRSIKVMLTAVQADFSVAMLTPDAISKDGLQTGEALSFSPVD